MSENNELSNLDEDELKPDDVMIHPERPLSPRHRKIAELWARGFKNQEIADDLHYTAARVSTIKNDPRVRALAMRYMDSSYEEAIAKRLKNLAEPAVNILEACLTDERGVFKKSEQLETAKWITEKLDGKAIQKHEVTGGLLVGMMDKLDAMKDVRPTLRKEQPVLLDVTPQDSREKLILAKAEAIPVEKAEEVKKTEEELLKGWCLDNL